VIDIPTKNNLEGAFETAK